MFVCCLPLPFLLHHRFSCVLFRLYPLSHRCPRKCILVVSFESLTCSYLCPPPIVTVTDDNKDEQEGKEAQAGDNGGDEEKLDESPGKPAKTAATPASSEFKKTWGFRRTTIAKREMPGETAAAPVEGPVRRSGRQAKRTDKLEEFLLTAKRGRGGGGRRSAPANLEGSATGDPPSQTPTDAETASEASFDGSAEVKTSGSKAASPERKRRRIVKKGGRRQRQTRSAKAKQEEEAEEEGASEDDASSEDEAADGAQDAQKEADKEEKKPEVVSVTTDIVAPSLDMQTDAEKMEVKKEEEKTKEEEEESKTKPEDTSSTRRPSRNPARACKDSTPSKSKAKARKEEDDDDDDDDESSSSSSSSSSSDEGGSNDEGYDPNALYCICRQKHNKR